MRTTLRCWRVRHGWLTCGLGNGGMGRRRSAGLAAVAADVAASREGVEDGRGMGIERAAGAETARLHMRKGKGEMAYLVRRRGRTAGAAAPRG